MREDACDAYLYIAAIQVGENGSAVLGYNVGVVTPGSTQGTP